MLTDLCLLARKFETDKGGAHFRYGGGDSDTCHNYTPVYHELFKDRRPEVHDVLEVGVHAGSSLRMWEEYFPNATILGLDTNEECLQHANRGRIYVSMADQNNPLQLISALAKHGPDTEYDLIIDDGSHERGHQLVTMATLLRYLAPKGFYVIEDLGNGGGPADNYRNLLMAMVPRGYDQRMMPIYGGLGPKVQPYEWLHVIWRTE